MANTDFSSQYLSDDLYDEDKVALSEFHSQKFWPEGLIDNLINEDVVRRELNRAYKHQYDDYLVDFTLNKAKRLFAITATVDSRPEWLLSAMSFFKANSFQDSNLLPEIENNNGSTAHSPNFSDRLAILNPTLWRQAMKSKFFEAQWKAMVPVFSTAKTTSDFNLKTILPFTEVDRSIKGGAFSRIYKVAIHRDHYKSDDSPENEKPTYFAVKEIVPPDKDERKRINESWVNEADALRKMNILNRANIVRFITAFTQGGADTEKSYYLMFEWADGGNLEDLWDQNPATELSAELIHKAVIQLKGLSAALSATHNQEHGVGYRHGDLKPENILRFQPKPESIFGTLKIGDWGLAKYHNTATVLRGENTTTKYGTTFYEPPEVELGRVKILGRQYDIWSMGCIILELIIWLLYGYAEVKRFRGEVKGNSKRQLPCYKIVDNNDGDQLTAKVHEVVVRWMDHIAQDPACAEELALGELLSLVRKELIVVELPPEKGQTFFIKGYSPPVRQVPTTLTPQIAVTAPSSRTSEFDQRRARRPQAYRTLSAELLKYLEDRILDDEDRVHDFWLRATPLDFKRQAPPNIARKPSSDSTGLLVPGRESHGRKRQTSGDRSNTSDKRRLEVQEQKFVSKDHLLPFTSVPADQ